nr:uncharacterized protein LOC124810878 [Hydra vulgaris]
MIINSKKVVCCHTGGITKTTVSTLFKPASQVSKMERVQCSFCNDIMSKSGTRMAMHIKKCKKCPAEVKHKFLNDEIVVQKHPVKDIIQSKIISQFKNLIPNNNFKSVTNIAPTLNSDALKHSEPTSKSGKSCLMFDSMKLCEKESIDVHLSRAIYASGSPLSLVENRYWKTFLNNLRPAYKIPTRNEMSNRLLDNEYNRISANVKEVVATADSLGFMCDGWSNVRNEAVINFVLTLPLSVPVLWKSLPSGKMCIHSSDYITEHHCVNYSR